MTALNGKKIHIMGIGGTGMAPIAVVLHEMGIDVRGSDRSESVYTEKLRKMGIEVMVPQRAENIGDPDYVFYSSAIHGDNPEFAEVLRRGIPHLKRRELLPLMLEGRKITAIAGSHGKSTTTSMCVWVFTALGTEPGFIIGSSLKNTDTNASAGKSDRFIIEADEYDNMFLGLHPYAAVMTKVEYDHPDCFPTHEIYREAFANFLSQTRQDGFILMNGDDPEQEQIKKPEGVPVYRYGIEKPCDFRAEELSVGENGCYAFTFVRENVRQRVGLRVPGKHNVYNAMVCLSLCSLAGLDLNQAAEALAEFSGISRRFEITDVWNGITLVDDYAHHPTEIRATLRAAREFFPGRRIWAVWQPHTFSRTRSLLDEFAGSFDDADEVIITDIFAARETYNGFGIPEVMAAMRHPSVRHLGTNADVSDCLCRELREGDVVVTLSAGDANLAAPMALERMKHAAA